MYPQGNGKESFDHLLGQGDEYVTGSPLEPTYSMTEPEDASMATWRAGCFVAAGIDPESATTLAMRRDIDREHVETLAARGASGAELCAMLL